MMETPKGIRAAHGALAFFAGVGALWSLAVREWIAAFGFAAFGASSLLDALDGRGPTRILRPIGFILFVVALGIFLWYVRRAAG